MMKKNKLHYAWFVLVGAILIRGFSAGGINASIGQFLLPVANEIKVGVGTLSIYLSIMSIVTFLFLPYGGKIINRYDIRVVASIGAVLLGLVFALCSTLNNVWMWYILAIPMAVGSTLLTNLMGPILINRWFVKNKGLIMGIQVAFVGLFGVIIQPITASIIQNKGWRPGCILLGGATFLVTILSSIFFIRNSPKDKGLVPYGAKEENDNQTASNSNAVQIDESTATKSKSFIMLLLFMTAVTGVGVFNQHIPTYGTVLGYSVNQTGLALSFTSLGTAIGSVAIGFICDKIGSLKTCYGIIGVELLALFGFWIGGTTVAIFYISAFFHGLVAAGTVVIGPILTLEFYGEKDYEKILSKVFMGAPLAAIVLVPAYGYIYDFTNSYRLVLLFIAILLVLSAVCISAGWKNRCTIEGCPTWRK
ncbi:MFS transporter [Anaerosporobacter faecicola]|uniref:MFS transporter n=1 Tax=Anaerosporobacter faecicola TaxID=2718714 RepID=UPI001EE5AAFA|nr:MFS transporter [Anaerosporobacter faecicola]